MPKKQNTKEVRVWLKEDTSAVVRRLAAKRKVSLSRAANVLVRLAARDKRMLTMAQSALDLD